MLNLRRCPAAAPGSWSLRGQVLQYDILTTGARASLAHLRERVERAAADNGFDLKASAEFLGATRATARG